MKGKTTREEMERPELQELLQKPSGEFLYERKIKVIPSQLQLSGNDKQRCSIPRVTEDSQPDVVTSAIGDYGRWQLMMTFLLSLFSFPCTFHIYLPIFTAKETQFWCKRPTNLSDLPVEAWINYSQPERMNPGCYVRDIPWDVSAESILNHTAPIIDAFKECTDWEWDRSEVGNTIISEWNLVCERAGLTNLAEVVFLVGVGIGGVLGGWVSDKFGRKRVLMAMVLAQSFLAIMALLVRSYLQYVLVRLVMGLVSVSVVFAAFVLAVELMGGKWVTIAGVCIFFPLPLSYIIVSLVSLVLPDWWNLQLALSIPGCLLLILWFILPESPAWLLTMGRVKEAKAILQKAADFNKRALPVDLDKMIMAHKSTCGEEKPSIVLLFKGVYLKRTICLFVTWFAMTIGYYGLLLNIGRFNLGNVHVTSIILAVVEIPAIAISIPILLKAGRRLPVFISMLLCGIACVASEVVGVFFKKEWLIIACLMVGKFAIGSTNMMLPIYTAELYPTIIRNVGVGICQISAGLALICVPYLWKLTVFSSYLPMITIAILCAAGGSTVLILPETANAPVLESLEEIHNKEIKSAFDSNVVPCNGSFTFTDDRGR